MAASYYVNDNSPIGDVFATAVGNDANDGLTAATPKRSLTNLLSVINLVQGDVVYIDTGTYTGSSTIGTNHVSSSTNFITFVGSTNTAAGGAVMRAPGTFAILLNANHIAFKNLSFRDSTYGVFWSANNVRKPRFENVTFTKNTYGAFISIGAGTGDTRFDRCAFVSNSIAIAALGGAGQFPRGFFVDRSVFVDNDVHIDGRWSDTDTIHNSVFVGKTVFGRRWWLGDHNIFWNIEYMQLAGSWGGRENYLVTISDLQNESGTNFFSTAADPMFASLGTLDFHPKSVTGRRVPSTGLIVTDTVHSALIDFGRPTSTLFTNEPAPNGGVMNAGMFGGTIDASMSRTNPWVFALSYNDSGTFYGTNALRWNYGGLPTNSTVKIDYSRNNGSSWVSLATGVAINSRSYTWNASSVTSTPVGRWRITSESVMSASDTNDRPFGIRGVGLIKYYVNDNSTAGDVYTTAVGNNTNDGSSISAPKATLQNILSNYVLRADHMVYIDTGVYTGSTVFITSRHYGEAGRDVIIQGSTNIGSNSSQFLRNSPVDDSFNLKATAHITLQDFSVQNAAVGLNLSENVEDVTVRGLIAAHNARGYRVWFSRNNTFYNSIGAYNQTAILVGNNSSGNFWLNGVCLAMVSVQLTQKSIS